MTKLKFITSLHDRLSGLPQDEVEERLSFYCEIIEDRMEEGISEEEAVSSLGSLDKIAEEIAADIPFGKIAKEKIKPKRKLKAWEIILLALGSPIWLSLLVAAISVALSLYAVLWSLVVSVWAVFVSVIACGVYGIIGGITFALGSDALPGIALAGAGIVCAGLSIFLFVGCKAATERVVSLTKQIGIKIKRGFITKEVAQ